MSGRRRAYIVVAGWASLVVAAAGGCDMLDMYDEPRYEPLEPSEFFPNGMSARPKLEGTVARGQLRDDVVLYTGLDDGEPTAAIPDNALTLYYEREHGRLGLPDTAPDEKALRLLFLERGRERFNIYCADCHGRLGNGDGMIVRRGFRRPPSYELERLRNAPSGHFFDVITHGFGVMPSFAARIDPVDRWAIVAYVRALQLAGDARLEDVPPDERANLDQKSPENDSAPQSEETP